MKSGLEKYFEEETYVSQLIKKAKSADILDNRDKTVIDFFKNNLLIHSTTIDLATGYLYLSGFRDIIDLIEKLDKIRIITDNVISRKNADDLIAAFSNVDKASQALKKENFSTKAQKESLKSESSEMIQKQLEIIDQTDDFESLINRLYQLVKSKKLEIRLLTKGRLHAKAYIGYFGQEIVGMSAIAIIGSSNLTASGLRSNTELNAVIRGDEKVGVVAQWFQELWKNSELFSKELLSIMEESWVLNEVRPYDIYLKMLIEMTKVQGEASISEEAFWETLIFEKLTGYQETAVKQAIRIIDDYKGVIIGDVVGLGKTYIGIALLRYFYSVRNERSIVICPPSLVEMWQDLLLQFGVPCQVISQAVLSQNRIDLLDEYYFGNISVVLIDESHNFRNSMTNRYKMLDEFLLEGKSGRKTILLTATPRNNNAWDIFNQLRLFMGEGTVNLPISPPNLKEYFKQILVEEKAKNSFEAKPELLIDLLRHVMIRRTRKHILKYYGEEDSSGRSYIPKGKEKLYFPERKLKTISYNIEDVYSAITEQNEKNSTSFYTEILDLLAQNNYARYGLWEYVKHEYRSVKPYNELNIASSNLKGLLRTLILKRFESSIFAFQKTIERMNKSNRLFLEALQQGFIVMGSLGNIDAQTLLLESDNINEIDIEILEMSQYENQAFDVERLQKNLINDIEILDKIYQIVSTIDVYNDDKLKVLIKILDENKKEGDNSENSGPKTIIFSQFSETAEYVYKELKKHFTSVKLVTSKTTNKLRILKQFSPRSNYAKLQPNEEINILVSTDVLSEGLNLQDAIKVINYDLHWNPVRLIQRVGRIDRLGSKNDEILAINFLPERNLDSSLGLKERIRKRITEIQRTIGEDAQILELSERVNEEAIYAIYHGESTSLDIETIGDSNIGVNISQIESLLEKTRNSEPDYYKYLQKLPFGVRSAKKSNSNIDETIVVCCTGKYIRIYSVDNSGTHKLAYWDALGKISCTKDESPVPIPKDHNKRVMIALETFKSELRAIASEFESSYQTPNRRYVIDKLSSYYRKIEADNDRRLTITQLIEGIKNAPKQLESVFKRAKTDIWEEEHLYIEIRDLFARLRLDPSSIKRKERKDFESPIILCSLAIIK